MNKKKKNFKNGLNTLISKTLLRSFFLLTLFSGNKAQADNTMCYDPNNVGSVGDAGTVCENMLIVDRALLDDGIADGKTGTNNSTFKITKNGTTYNFKDKVFTGQVENFSNLFKGAGSFNADIGNWDTSNATKMNGMFFKAKKFNQDIGSWNVANVKNMGSMFREADDFNQSLDNWDVSSVTNMRSMFHGADDFNGSINNWGAKTGSVTNMRSMFQAAKSFNKHIQTWNVSNVKVCRACFTELQLLIKLSLNGTELIQDESSTCEK